MVKSHGEEGRRTWPGGERSGGSGRSVIVCRWGAGTSPVGTAQVRLLGGNPETADPTVTAAWRGSVVPHGRPLWLWSPRHPERKLLHIRVCIQGLAPVPPHAKLVKQEQSHAQALRQADQHCRWPKLACFISHPSRPAKSLALLHNYSKSVIYAQLLSKVSRARNTLFQQSGTQPVGHTCKV